VPNKLREGANKMASFFTSCERSTEERQAIVTFRDTASGNAGAPRSATVAARMGAGLDMTSTATIRYALRALASETGLQGGLRGVKFLRPVVAQAHDVLRERLESGGSVEDYLRGRARLADSAVVGLLHIASTATEMRGDSMVAPLSVVAVGGYGRCELAPSSDLDLLFLLPERNQAGPAAATAACIRAVVAGLWDLGFVLDHAARSAQESLDLAQIEAAVLATLLDRRFLWGSFGLFATLDANLARLFSGPRAARWRRAVDSAMTSTHRHASHGAQTPEDEPDVKRGPGGLRDLQRTLVVGMLASGRPQALAEPTLIDARRFLWLVRCHLHLLVGRAEDRLKSAVQPAVARRVGFSDSPGTTAASRLLQHFHRHANNVIQAAALATTSAPAKFR
jgi:[protein-PII] uridylyltransferase